MRILLNLLFVFILLQSCQSDQVSPPKDLIGKKNFLQKKQKELKELNTLIAQVEAEIAAIDPNAKQEQSTMVVTTQPVERTDFNRFIELQASVKAENLVSASSETAGRITRLYVKEGQYVKRRQIIANIDVESIKKKIVELEKALELATDLHARKERLWKKNIGSEFKVTEAKNNKERIQKNIETVKYNLKKGAVRAPSAGIVDKVLLTSGETTVPGMPIVKILNTSKVKVVADIPEKFIRHIKQGQMMTVKVPALEIEKEGKVTMLGRTINPANRTFQVEINLPNQGGLLKPNLLANVLLNDFSAEDAIAIPLKLVQQEVSGDYFVYIHDKNENGSIAKKVNVNIGETYEDQIMITEGLNGGEELIVDGAQRVSNDEPIQIRALTEAERLSSNF